MLALSISRRPWNDIEKLSMCRSRLCLSLTTTPEALRSVARASFFISDIGPFSPSSTLVAAVLPDSAPVEPEVVDVLDETFSPLAAALAAFSLEQVSTHRRYTPLSRTLDA